MINKEILNELKPYIQHNKDNVTLKDGLSYKQVSDNLGIKLFQLVELILAVNINYGDN